jgi:hypothetical protein
LVRTLLHQVAAYGGQLQELLTRPGMAELLSISPAAARIFRPLMHMLGLPNPAPRPRPARKPRTRARRAAAPPPLDLRDHSRPLPRDQVLGREPCQAAAESPASISLIQYYAALPFRRAAHKPSAKPRTESPPDWPWFSPPAKKPA